MHDIKEIQEAKVQKTKDQITAEYSKLCVLLGDRIFKIHLYREEIPALKRQMDELTKEANALEKAQPQGSAA